MRSYFFTSANQHPQRQHQVVQGGRVGPSHRVVQGGGGARGARFSSSRGQGSKGNEG